MCSTIICPDNAEDYVHRIGRTGRAGSTGVSISFAGEDDSFALPAIEKVHRSEACQRGAGRSVDGADGQRPYRPQARSSATGHAPDW
ncbi:MAG: hypothetical protein MH219_05720 [Marinobacter sp.]|nr:hypothetical protein [Marinobacter sp.]